MLHSQPQVKKLEEITQNRLHFLELSQISKDLDNSVDQIQSVTQHLSFKASSIKFEPDKLRNDLKEILGIYKKTSQ